MIKTILIVDDDAVTLRLLKERLISAGYQVVQAQTGQRAKDKAIGQAIDAIIMDILLPDMEGSEVIAFLKRQEKFRDTKVIFLSGIVSPQEGYDSEILAGGKEYPAIGKPVDMDRLLRLLKDD